MTNIDRAKYLSAKELDQLFKTIEGRKLLDEKAGRMSGVLRWAVVDLALATGFRVGEIARLTIGDIDFRRASIRVTRLKRRQPLTETVAISKSLKKHLAEYLEHKRLLGHSMADDAALFVGKRGPMGRRGLQHLWATAIRDAGLPAELSIHSARHTLAVHLLEKTSNLRKVQKQLGHTNINTTATMYADVTFESMQASMDDMYDR